MGEVISFGVERTLVMVKPDATGRNVAMRLLSRFEEEGLRVLAVKSARLSRACAERFYQVHRGKPFFDALVDFVSSGPVVVALLEGEGAIARAREVMGATDPSQAQEGTLRRLYGTDVTRNAVHGSDSPESASREISFFFPEGEVISLWEG